MVINSNKNMSDLQKDVQEVLGEFFRKSTLKELCRVVMGKGKINLEIVKGNSIKHSDGIFIKEITTYYSNYTKEEVDLSYDVITGNLVPGVIKQTLEIMDGVLKNKRGLFNNALVSKSNSIVFKEKQIKVRNKVENRSIVYALLSGGKDGHRV